MRAITSGVILAASLAVGSSTHADEEGDRNCSDFSTQREAQQFYEANGPGDPHRLDRDKDGVACESLS